MESSMIDLFGISPQFLGMPVSSAALFLFAGMLLGHLFWYRDRGKKLASDPDLETRYIKARSSLKQRKSQLRELQKQNDSNSEDLTILQQAHSTLRSKYKRLEQSSQSSQEQLNQSRHSLNDSEIQLADEEKRSQTVISQLQELIEKNTTLANENKTHHEGFEQLHQQYRQCISDLETAHCEIDILRSHINAHQSEVDGQQSSIEHLKKRVATQDQALKETNESLQQTQQDLVARCQDLDEARAERNQFEQQLQDRQQILEQLETDLDLAKQIQIERDDFATNLAAAASSLSEQRQTLEHCETELKQKTNRLGELEQKIDTTNSQFEEEQAHRLQLEQFNTACQTQLADLENQISVKSTECEKLDIALSRALDTVAQSETLIPTLLLELEESAAKQLALRTKLTDLQKLLEQQQEQSSGQQAQIAELCSIREASVIHSLDLVEARAQLTSETAKVAALHEQIEEWNTTLAKLETAQQTIQQYHERNAALESRLVQQTDQLSVLTEQANRVPELELDLERRLNEIDQAYGQIEQHKEMIQTAEQICDETQCELVSAIAEIYTMEIRIERICDDIRILSSDNAILTAANQQANDQAQQMQIQLNQSQVSQKQLNDIVKELRAVKLERQQLISTRDNLEATISRLGNQITTHLTETKQMNEVLSHTTLEYQKLEMGLHAEVETRNTTIAELKTQLMSKSQQHNEVVDDLALKTSKLTQQKIELEQVSNELLEKTTKLDQQQRELALVSDELARKTTNLDQQQCELALVSDELEVAKATHEKQLRLEAEEIDDLRRQLKSKSEQHEALVNDHNSKKHEVIQQLSEIKQLSTELEGAIDDRRERERLQQEVTEIKSHLNCVREELEDSLETNAKGQDRIRDMENQLHDHVKKIRDLRRERSSSSAIQTTNAAKEPGTGSDRKAA
ncbi:hypothetical protein N9B38_00015 [bacterium]|nr:hypothetical protein [bacterium]